MRMQRITLSPSCLSSQCPYLPPERSLMDRNLLLCLLVCSEVLRWRFGFFPPSCPSCGEWLMFTSNGAMEQAGCSPPYSWPLGTHTLSGSSVCCTGLTCWLMSLNHHLWTSKWTWISVFRTPKAWCEFCSRDPCRAAQWEFSFPSGLSLQAPPLTTGHLALVNESNFLELIFSYRIYLGEIKWQSKNLKWIILLSKEE